MKLFQLLPKKLHGFACNQPSRIWPIDAKCNDASSKAKKAPRNYAPKHMIDDLPPAARHHTEPGHFQMDTVHSSGGRGDILTLVDPTMAIQQRFVVSICTPFQPFLKPP